MATAPAIKVPVEMETTLGTIWQEIEWTSPRSGETTRVRFWQAVAQGASLMLVCTDATGRFRAYRAEECRAVLP